MVTSACVVYIIIAKSGSKMMLMVLHQRQAVAACVFIQCMYDIVEVPSHLMHHMLKLCN